MKSDVCEFLEPKVAVSNWCEKKTAEKEPAFVDPGCRAKGVGRLNNSGVHHQDTKNCNSLQSLRQGVFGCATSDASTRNT
jgi:hypothetical protein